MTGADLKKAMRLTGRTSGDSTVAYAFSRAVEAALNIDVPPRAIWLRAVMAEIKRLAKLVALFCIFSWRVPWMTMMPRADPEADPATAFTTSEIAILDHLIGDTGNRAAKSGTLQLYLIKIARLGGYRARTADPPPGNTVVWRGLRRLADIQLGTERTTSATYG